MPAESSAPVAFVQKVIQEQCPEVAGRMSIMELKADGQSPALSKMAHILGLPSDSYDLDDNGPR